MDDTDEARGGGTKGIGRGGVMWVGGVRTCVYGAAADMRPSPSPTDRGLTLGQLVDCDAWMIQTKRGVGGQRGSAGGTNSLVGGNGALTGQRDTAAVSGHHNPKTPNLYSLKNTYPICYPQSFRSWDYGEHHAGGVGGAPPVCAMGLWP